MERYPKKRKVSSVNNEDTKTELQRSVVSLFDGRRYRLTILDSKTHSHETRWDNATPDERVDLVMKATNGKAVDSYHPFFQIFTGYRYSKSERISLSEIKSVYSLVSQIRRQKNGMILEIIRSFYGLSDIEEKTSMEKDIVKSIDKDLMNKRFFRMCDVDIPADIILQIFEFIPRTKNCIIRVGRICKYFYLYLIRTLDSLVVNGYNFRYIPVYVINNARHVLATTETMFNYKGLQCGIWGLTQIWNNCSHENLQGVSVQVLTEYSVFEFLKTLDFLSRKVWQSRYFSPADWNIFPLINITKLEFSYTNRFDKKEFEGKKGSSFYAGSKTLGSTLPYLKKVYGITGYVNDHLLKDSGYLEKIGFRYVPEVDHLKKNQIIMYPDKIRGLEFLIVDISDLKSDGKLSKLLRSYFTKVSVLRIEFDFSMKKITNFNRNDRNKPIDVLPKSFQINLHDIFCCNDQSGSFVNHDRLFFDKVEFSDVRFKKPLNMEYIPEAKNVQICPVFLSSKLFRVKNLNIHSICGTIPSEFPLTHEIDFNLCDLMISSSKFLFQSDILKTFRGRIPLFSRKLVKVDPKPIFDLEFLGQMFVGCVQSLSLFLMSVCDRFDSFNLTISCKANENFGFRFDEGLIIESVKKNGINIMKFQYNPFSTHSYSSFGDVGVVNLEINERMRSKDEEEMYLKELFVSKNEIPPLGLLFAYLVKKVMMELKEVVQVFTVGFGGRCSIWGESSWEKIWEGDEDLLNVFEVCDKTSRKVRFLRKEN